MDEKKDKVKSPYKDFNRQIAEHFQKQNNQNNEQYSNNNPEEN